MSLKSSWEKYQSFVTTIAPTATIISLILGVIVWINRDNKLFFFIIIGVIVLLLVLIITWCYRFRRMNKYVFLTWQQKKFAQQEKLCAEKMREAYSKMIDYQNKIKSKQGEREKVWMELLDSGGEISKAKKRQKIANRFLESADETHEAAMERRIRVLIWLINSDQLDLDENPYRAIRDKYIPHQIFLRKDRDNNSIERKFINTPSNR